MLADRIGPLYRSAAIPLPPVRRIAAWERHRRVAEAVDALGDDLLVLDVGCGRGPVARMLAGRHRLVGIDPDVDALAEFSRFGLAVAGDALSLPFADGTFDAVVCSQSLTNMPPPYDGPLGEIARVLRPDGTLVVEHGMLADVSLWPLVLYWALRRRLPGGLRLSFAGRRTTWGSLRRALLRTGFTAVRRVPLELSSGPLDGRALGRRLDVVAQELPGLASQQLVLAERA